MPPTTAAACQRHPKALAGWRCQSCGAALCPECAVGRRVQTVELVACGPCGGDAQVLGIHRGAVPLSHRLKKAWRYPFSAAGFQLLVALSLFLATVAWFAEMSFLLMRAPLIALYGGLFWATFFGLVQESARGDTSLDIPDFSDIFRDAIVPGLRGLMVFVLAALPALAYGYLTHTGAHAKLDAFAWFIQWELPPDLLKDPVLWALLLLGGLWLPMGLLLAATGQPPWHMLDPRLVLRLARGLGSDYLLTTFVLALLVLLQAVAHGVAAGLRALDLVIISRVLAECVTLVVPFLAAHVLGLLLYVRGDQVGYGEARDYLEPVLGNTRPLKDAPSLHSTGLLTEHVTEAASPGGEAGASQASATEQLSALATAVGGRDVPRALELYAALEQLPASRVPAEHHLFIGQAAAVEGNFPLAVAALERAADVAPDAPTAPRALVLLARVLGERMNEMARAEEVYQYVLHRYPDTSAARYAGERTRLTSD
ncbi:tetratricopeptide repeat protein [Myxococcus llanfairpwllgwyngyllgogerychwyrndrobwllllantysiliogogogochensis]|uniref:Tetratricopeptide repeat protein n=1 Tax=Myxococcus llanfairpwllgwyngyllgogerychwyrndrobwllllantysiliogogogochensis TaxID=2590453 RepID=A0A540WTV7_9BACT|nr:tetratricopeptide repeat protein [Myxococcus llanfairpwllgwyngyllgogerychwyrndrobwllllantysiliogogogochensis]TQF12436.1 tetratricopeptide repeat protein [Myxococcus llanfairpwllgwyngyllgogerychwyrndrobwllllantysiliogogogochensis]